MLAYFLKASKKEQEAPPSESIRHRFFRSAIAPSFSGSDETVTSEVGVSDWLLKPPFLVTAFLP
jgi:hypothetical protein